MDRFVQVGVNISRDQADSVTKILQHHGAMSVTVTCSDDQECFDNALPGEPRWEHQRLCALFDPAEPLEAMIEAIRPCLDSRPELIIGEVADRDWEPGRLASASPFRVGPGLWVCPGERKPESSGETSLLIGPGLAFGTGAHETTRLCLEQLAQEEVAGKTVIDIGCGSGILAIAAVKLGARLGIGVDIDPRALETAASNARINAVEEKIMLMSDVEFADTAKTCHGEMVIANILTPTIIQWSATILSVVERGGTILLCGILKPEAVAVKMAFGAQVDFMEKTLNNWVLLIGHVR
ncbi:MAG: 50S ribosomal protein L11 methyltransferase [Gammaproteobacteria bacterium]|nr:50S ribosomal protein L11 methyltransferase [Gammaproteobacteria bacterium]